ncbi:type II secretion system protein M [Colwellia sp. D2M02]|uniref:Type II secretion system protein M n=1 Tax=Colwellia asteriadis TaxID=517723 RepID=A0ABP3WFZ8_9GAMM|nr:type II secretion system protein M [Colwellia sp. D2M02]MBU2891749.1 type II secretion system protein M [Colwellia sp. D2M02]
MKAWWQQLNSREQALIAAMAAVITIFIFYSAIWQPLNSNLINADKKLVRQQALLTWVNENTQRYKRAQGVGGSSQSQGSLSGIVNRSANSYQLTITRVQPQGDDIQVWLDSVPFTQLLFWLEHLVNNEKIHVESIDLARADRSGEVKVRRLQLSRH